MGYQKITICLPSKWLENHPESPTFHLAAAIRQRSTVPPQQWLTNPEVWLQEGFDGPLTRPYLLEYLSDGNFRLDNMTASPCLILVKVPLLLASSLHASASRPGIHDLRSGLHGLFMFVLSNKFMGHLRYPANKSEKKAGYYNISEFMHSKHMKQNSFIFSLGFHLILDSQKFGPIPQFG